MQIDFKKDREKMWPSKARETGTKRCSVGLKSSSSAASGATGNKLPHAKTGRSLYSGASRIYYRLEFVRTERKRCFFKKNQFYVVVFFHIFPEKVLKLFVSSPKPQKHVVQFYTTAFKSNAPSALDLNC